MLEFVIQKVLLGFKHFEQLVLRLAFFLHVESALNQLLQFLLFLNGVVLNQIDGVLLVVNNLLGLLNLLLKLCDLIRLAWCLLLHFMQSVVVSKQRSVLVVIITIND